MDGPMSILDVPLVAWALGSLFLYISLFTLTIPRRSLIFVRIALAPPAIICYWKFGYGSYKIPTQTVAAGPATIGLYGIMRVLEHSIINVWDPIPPYWVSRINGQAYPPPQKFRERCYYAFDLLTSLRGSSWFADVEWNWIPRHLRLWKPSRKQFLIESFKTMAIQFLLLDLCDTVNKSRNWDIISPYPVTSLPIVEQLIFSISICAGTAISIVLPYTAISFVCVLCGSSPGSWPPMFNSPFNAVSLRDFWSNRWHWIFRRVFGQLSIPLVYLSSRTASSNEFKARIAAIIRPAVTFAFSALLHLIIMYRLASREYRKRGKSDNPLFWDPAVIKFFMCQPLGLFIESAMATHVVSRMFPQEQSRGDRQPAAGTQRSVEQSRSSNIHDSFLATLPAYRQESVVTMRVYAWLFLLWTGRWWADKWVAVGYFHKEEVVVPFSVWRGLWLGQWVP